MGGRCVPWANDGGNAWNATRCSVIDPVPDQLGDLCTSLNGVGGVDSCDIGLLCWGVDGETNTGTCIELCGCGPASPTCAGGGTVCNISNQNSLPVCLPTCDPLDPACPAGQGCYLVNDAFLCAPDASGGSVVGDVCTNINTCPPGLSCVAWDLFPVCLGSSCCAEFCDVDEGEGPCSFADAQCVPLFALGDEPEACHVDTGICIDPA